MQVVVVLTDFVQSSVADLMVITTPSYNLCFRLRRFRATQ